MSHWFVKKIDCDCECCLLAPCCCFPGWSGQTTRHQRIASFYDLKPGTQCWAVLIFQLDRGFGQGLSAPLDVVGVTGSWRLCQPLVCPFPLVFGLVFGLVLSHLGVEKKRYAVQSALCRDSRRDVNALLDDFKNSDVHFFKCLVGMGPPRISLYRTQWVSGKMTMAISHIIIYIHIPSYIMYHHVNYHVSMGAVFQEYDLHMYTDSAIDVQDGHPIWRLGGACHAAYVRAVWFEMLSIYLYIYVYIMSFHVMSFRVMSCYDVMYVYIYIYYQRKFHGGNSELRTFTFSLAQRSLCPVGMCLKRSWSHIVTSPEIIVSSWHVP